MVPNTEGLEHWLTASLRDWSLAPNTHLHARTQTVYRYLKWMRIQLKIEVEMKILGDFITYLKH